MIAGGGGGGGGGGRGGCSFAPWCIPPHADAAHISVNIQHGAWFGIF